MAKARISGIEVNLSTERKELLEGGWESGRIQSMLANINWGDMVFDIGAEQGDISVLLAKKTGKICLFEPSPVMWSHIRSNFESNKLEPVACYHGLVSDKDNDKPKELDYQTKYKGVYPMSAYNEKQDVRAFRHLNEHFTNTTQTKLDSWCARNNIYPDMITIDVEGSEWHVLQGMTEVIDKAQPLIYISVHDELMAKMYGKYFHDIYWETLRDNGYKVVFLGHDHESHFLFYKKSYIPVIEVL